MLSKEEKDMKNMTPDEKLVYVEPEMEIVAFDKNDIETSPINSDDWWWGDEDNVQGGVYEP